MSKITANRSRGGRKGVDHKALQESVVHVFDNLDPEMNEFEKRLFHIKVYTRYYNVTKHKMHTYNTYPISRIQGLIRETTCNKHGWKTIDKKKVIYGIAGERTEKYTRYLRRLSV